MRGQMKQVLVVCVAVLAVLVVAGWSEWLKWALVPAVPLLAALYAMHLVKGSAYIWWHRFAVPWTVASMCAVMIVPLTGKPFVATLSVLVLSILTLVILVRNAIIPHYRIARAVTE